MRSSTTLPTTLAVLLSLVAACQTSRSAQHAPTSLEQWTRRAGLGDTARTVLDELATIQSVDVVLPTTDARTLRIRCVVKPKKPQAMLLERLGIQLPRRLERRESGIASVM